MKIIWRIAAVALAAGLVLFLVSLILKFLLVGLVLFLLVRVVGPRLAGRSFGPLGRGNWPGSNIIAIDAPNSRPAMSQGRFDRIIAVS